MIAGIGGCVVASRTSRPLRRIARTAAEIDAGRLSLRIRAKGPRDEVRVLADAFDRMLDRLEDAFARQRGFVSDASHELRTPLTVVRGQLEVLARQPDPTREDVARVEGLVRLELAAHAAPGRGPPPARARRRGTARARRSRSTSTRS